MRKRSETRVTEVARGLGLLLVAIAVLGLAQPAIAQDVDIAGAWQAERYILADGAEHPVSGRIFFTGNDWTVLFFVLDGTGMARRGSGEGGTFTLTGDRLVFTHLFHLSAGEALPGLAASELRMAARGPDDDAPEEPCRVTRTGDRLRLDFPSGNAMTFTRSAGGV